MKILIVLLFVGIAAASFYDDLEKSTDDAVEFFLLGIEEAPVRRSVHDVNEIANENEEDINAKSVKQLRKNLYRILDKIKDAIEKGKTKGENLLNKLKDVREKIKDRKAKVGQKAKGLIKTIKNKMKELHKEIFDELRFNKRSINGQEIAISEMTLREMLRKLKEHLLEKVEPEFIKEKILKIFGQASELARQLLETLREKGREKLMMLIDHLLGDDEDDVHKRSLSDWWKKIKDYFQDLQIDLKEKFFKFGEWVKENFDKGMKVSKDKFENVKVLGQQFLKHAKGISGEIAEEALEFFHQYKEELGDLWEEIKNSVKEISDKDKLEID